MNVDPRIFTFFLDSAILPTDVFSAAYSPDRVAGGLIVPRCVNPGVRD
jgi:hypothetical protein